MSNFNTLNTREIVGIVKSAQRSRYNNLTSVTIKYMVAQHQYEISEDVDCPLDAVVIGQPIKITCNIHAPHQAHIIGNSLK